MPGMETVPAAVRTTDSLLQRTHQADYLRQFNQINSELAKSSYSIPPEKKLGRQRHQTMTISIATDYLSSSKFCSSYQSKTLRTLILSLEK